MTNLRLLLVLSLVLLFAACAKPVPVPEPAPEPAPKVEAAPLGSVLLLADPNGHVGRIVITDTKGKSMVLDKEEYVVRVDADMRLTAPEKMSKDAIQRDFGDVLRAMPEAPVVFLLHFTGKTANLDKESKALLKEIAEVFKARKSTDISVIGYTDRRGDAKYNMLVSDKRAQAVSKMLFKKYRIPWEAMEVDSFGEAFPLVDTEDGKSHPENARVEVTIR